MLNNIEKEMQNPKKQNMSSLESLRDQRTVGCSSNMEPRRCTAAASMSVIDSAGTPAGCVDVQ